MKLIVSFGYLLIIGFLAKNVEAFTDAQKLKISTKLISVGIQCIRDNPLTVDELKSFKDKVFPEGENPKCFAACVFKKIGIMDEDGMISAEGTRESAEKVFKGNEEYLNNVDEILKICISVNKEKDDEEGCDRAKMAYTCFMENGPKYGFDFDY